MEILVDVGNFRFSQSHIFLKPMIAHFISFNISIVFMNDGYTPFTLFLCHVVDIAYNLQIGSVLRQNYIYYCQSAINTIWGKVEMQAARKDRQEITMKSICV